MSDYPVFSDELSNEPNLDVIFDGDEEISNLLVSWELSVNALMQFNQCGIKNIELLGMLHSHDIDEILNKRELIADKIRFRRNLQMWRSENNLDMLRCCSCYTTNTNDSSISKPILPLISTPIFPPISTPTCNISLEQILKDTVTGSDIINKYKNIGQLFERDQSEVVRIIVDHYIKCDVKMTPVTMKAVADEIVKLFPTENESIYYVSRTHKKNASGKLYDRYFNTICKRKAQLKDCTPSKISKVVSNEAPANFNTIKQWLKHNIPEELYVLWKETSEERIREHKFGIQDILREWPRYFDANGYELIDIDFETMFPGKSELMFDKIESIEEATKILIFESALVKDKLNLNYYDAMINASEAILKVSDMSHAPDTSFIPDLPKGPLCQYRNRAKFDWKQLKLVFEREKDLRIKYKVWDHLEKDPLFSKHTDTLSPDEQKHICAMQVNRMPNLDLIPKEIEMKSFSEKTKFLMSVNEALHIYSPSLSVKIALGVGLFNNAIRAMGTERHMKYYDAAWNRELITCLAITEVAHGSNTKNIRTTATYDPKTQEFIINTPDFEAAKCWVGNLGKMATIAMTFANLYTADGENHGLHGFLIPIRDPTTLQAYPGVLVGDIGEKIGLNGIDNGFVMFSNYRIPRENLLNRTSDVTPEGVYESVFNEPEKILGGALESFSAGRIGITQESTNTLASAAVIAVRYAALRKQFGPEKDGPETAIIEYQLHQWRIFPYLSAACVLKVAVAEMTETYLEIIATSQKESNGFELLTQIVSEIHAVISSMKPLITWAARDAIQEAREACGGHGYLKASKLGDLRNDHDPSVTYEGDNNVLGQQASNWLLRQWNGTVESPMGTANFLKKRDVILKNTFQSVLNKTPMESTDFAVICYEWMLCYLLEKTSKRRAAIIKSGGHPFDARNNSQVYGARDISLAYAEYFALCRFRECYRRSNTEIELRKVLKVLFDVYSLWCVDRHMANFYIGGFAKSDSFAETIRTRLLSKYAELKESAVSVADALASPDFALNSIIGKSDGLLYENLQSVFMTNKGAFERPSWWKDVIIPKVKSKI